MKDEDREAFERLCRDEYSRLVRTAWIITGDWQEAMDLAQEALIRAYTRWGAVSSLELPSAWLRREAARDRPRARISGPGQVAGDAGSRGGRG